MSENDRPEGNYSQDIEPNSTITTNNSLPFETPRDPHTFDDISRFVDDEEEEKEDYDTQDDWQNPENSNGEYAIEKDPHLEEISSGEKFWGATTSGQSRVEFNEDHINALPHFWGNADLYLVADGYQGGAYVSDFLAQDFPNLLKQKLIQRQGLFGEGTVAAEFFREQMVNPEFWLNLADETCREMQHRLDAHKNFNRSERPADENPQGHFGSTLTAVFVDQEKDLGVCINIGDSPAFFIDDQGRPQQISRVDRTELSESGLSQSFLPKGKHWTEPNVALSRVNNQSLLVVGSDSLGSSHLSRSRQKVVSYLGENQHLQSLRELTHGVVALAVEGDDHVSVIIVDLHKRN